MRRTVNLRLSYFVFILTFILPATIWAQVDTVWTKAFGDSSVYIISADNAASNGFILVGSSDKNDTTLWVLRLNSDGDTLWTKDLVPVSYADGAKVFSVSDGGYVILARAQKWLTKLSSDGTIEWQSDISDIEVTLGEFMFTGFLEDDAGAYICTGFTRTSDMDTTRIVKLSNTGTLTWKKNLGKGWPEGLIKTSAGNLAVTGSIENDSGEKGPGIRFFTTDGELLSSHLFKNFTVDGEGYSLKSLEETSAGNFLMAGRYYISDQKQRYWVVVADGSGNVLLDSLYSFNYSGEAGFATEISSGYLVGGMAADTVSGDLYPLTLYLSAAGDTIWTSDFGIVGGVLMDYVRSESGDILFVGGRFIDVSSFTIQGMAVLITFDSSTNALIVGVPQNYGLSQNYPNPFNPVTTINYSLPANSFVNITIYDILGKEVINLYNDFDHAGSKQIQWKGVDKDGEKVGSGVYFYHLKAGEFQKTMKMVLLK